MVRRMDGWTDGWMDEQPGKQAYILAHGPWGLAAPTTGFPGGSGPAKGCGVLIVDSEFDMLHHTPAGTWTDLQLHGKIHPKIMLTDWIDRFSFSFSDTNMTLRSKSCPFCLFQWLRRHPSAVDPGSRASATKLKLMDAERRKCRSCCGQGAQASWLESQIHPEPFEGRNCRKPQTMSSWFNMNANSINTQWTHLVVQGVSKINTMWFEPTVFCTYPWCQPRSQ